MMRLLLRCKMNDKQQTFIILRAKGLSFDKIATKLNTSKPTLIQWSKLFEEQIKDIQFEAFIKIKEAYSHNTKAKYENLLKQLNKIDEAILNADLSHTSIKDLFSIKNHLYHQIESLEQTIKANPHITQTNEFGLKEELYLTLKSYE